MEMSGLKDAVDERLAYAEQLLRDRIDLRSITDNDERLIAIAEWHMRLDYYFNQLVD